MSGAPCPGPRGGPGQREGPSAWTPGPFTWPAQPPSSPRPRAAFLALSRAGWAGTSCWRIPGSSLRGRRPAWEWGGREVRDVQAGQAWAGVLPPCQVPRPPVLPPRSPGHGSRRHRPGAGGRLSPPAPHPLLQLSSFRCRWAAGPTDNQAGRSQTGLYSNLTAHVRSWDSLLAATRGRWAPFIQDLARNPGMFLSRGLPPWPGRARGQTPAPPHSLGGQFPRSSISSRSRPWGQSGGRKGAQHLGSPPGSAPQNLPPTPQT